MMNIPKARELWGSGGNSDSQRSLDFEHGQFGNKRDLGKV